MGRLNPQAPWNHIGALTQDRIEAHSKGWMLPSCHLLYGESPAEAIARIAREQLGFDNIEQLHLSGPKVYSEVYAPKRHPESSKHWDLQFLYEGTIRSNLIDAKMLNAWTELSFVDIDQVNKNKIARSHEDILARLE